MYTTCVWCVEPLGRNDVIEAFPVGRRLAFDQAKGRLWVVCRACERWNLVPLEERAEAIEACARAFRGTPTRVSSGEIGLARMREGLDLVRIGTPLTPEFAAWRYGDQFLRRRRRAQVGVAAGTLGVVGAVAGGAGMMATGSVLMLPGLMALVHWGVGVSLTSRYRRIGAVPRPSGGLTTLTAPMLEQLHVIPEAHTLRVRYPSLDSTFAPNIPGTDRLMFQELEGPAASEAVDRAIVGANRRGASRAVVADAVAVAGAVRDPLALLGDRATRLVSLSAPQRLAIELRLHEADERRWLEGELADLERRWREAEQVAGIVSQLDRSPNDGETPTPR